LKEFDQAKHSVRVSLTLTDGILSLNFKVILSTLPFIITAVSFVYIRCK